MSKIYEGFKVDKSEYTKIYDTEDYLLVVPHTHMASCKYGANTKWCTTKRNDDSDFEEHVTMGVLVYLIIKNPEISKNMSSEKYGLYRVNGYTSNDLIVYDELNNEHLNGISYLSNEFEKVDKDLDFWKILKVYNKYYESKSIDSIMKNKPEKLEENITVDMIKDLCNRMYIVKKSGFGTMTTSSMVYYTKGGKVVDVEPVKGLLKVPFKIGDSIHEVIRWCEEKGLETKQLPRKNSLREQEEGEDSPSFVETMDPTLYNICVFILSGRMKDVSEEDLDILVKRHQKEYGDEHLTGIDYHGPKSADLIYEFDSADDFTEYFADNSESYWYWGLNSPDYDYYSDSVYHDIQEENYQWIQLKREEQLKLSKALLDAGFTLKNYEDAVANQNQWGNDELSFELRYLFEFHFKSYHDRLTEKYEETSVNSYAEGYYNEMRKVWEGWTKAAESAGIEEYEEIEEYHVDPAKLFRFLIKPSVSKLPTLDRVIEKHPTLYNEIGGNAEVFSMEDSRYEHEVPEYWDELHTFINEWIDKFINDELTDNPYIEEFKRESESIKSLGLQQSPHATIHGLSKQVDNRWSTKSIEDLVTNIKQKVKNFPESNIIKTTEGKVLIYVGYSIEQEGHIVYIENELSDEDKNLYYTRRFVNKRILTLEELVSLIRQTKLKFDLNEQVEGDNSKYYALTGDLIDYYGEENVTLTGEPPVIKIYNRHLITLVGDDLMINKKKIIVNDTRVKTINGSKVDYPSVAYITNRIPKQKKMPDNFVDGTKIKASQSFWDNVKVDEGKVGSNGEPALEAYRLGDGRITIGWGHTGALTGPTPKIGDTITRDQAQKYLQNDATEAANCVRRMLSGWKKQGLSTYMVSQNMFDVLVSLVFNAGCQGLRTSKFIQLVKKGEYKKAANLLPKDTTMIHGKFTKGLTARRKRESERFLK